MGEVERGALGLAALDFADGAGEFAFEVGAVAVEDGEGVAGVGSVKGL